MLQPVDISGGQVSGVDALSPAPSLVRNYEVDEAGVNTPRAALVSQSVTNLGASPVIGAIHWNEYTVLVTEDRYIYTIWDGDASLATARSTSTLTTQLQGMRRPTFATSEDYVYIAGGGRVSRWGPSLLTAEQLSSSPLLTTHIAALGNRLVANNLDEPQRYYWSDIGEGAWSTWPAANTTTADARPDPVVGIFENINELFVFGDQTLQVYGVGSDPTLPYDKISTINLGLAAYYCAIRLKENFVVLSDQREVVITDGRSASDPPISKAIQRDIRDMDTVSDAHGWWENEGQFSKLVLRFPTEGRTFAYDMHSQKWSERDKYTAPFHGDYPAGAYAYRPSDNKHLIGLSSSSGGLAYLSRDVRSDLGAPLVCERVTGWNDFGTGNRKRSTRVKVVMRRGTAAQGATPGALEIRTQEDDGPWSEWEQISVGTPSEYEQTVDVFLGGIFRRRRYHLRYSSTDATALAGLYDDVEDLLRP